MQDALFLKQLSKEVYCNYVLFDKYYYYLKHI
jgi:hypothetical protein